MNEISTTIGSKITEKPEATSVLEKLAEVTTDFNHYNEDSGFDSYYYK